LEKTRLESKNKNELVITREFDAPVERVWKAWTDPESVKHWWSPKEWSTPVFRMDFRVGGKFVMCMRGPDGKDIWGTGIYREIVPLQRFVVTDSFADEKGNVVPATKYGMNPDMPLEMLITVTLEKLGPNKTRMTLRHSGMPASEQTGANQGWSEMFDKLVQYLAKR
jgi:uncharacterized protein YndB with AHSA1/START domain